MEGRMNYVDMARGVAIILVMIGHSVLFPACGAIHIPTFFVLTGLLVTMESLEKSDLKGCLKKRVVRLLYPYAFYSAVLLLVRLAKDLVSGEFLIVETLKNIFGVIYSSTDILNGEKTGFLCFRVGNEGLWFLTTMVCACGVFYVLVYDLKKKGFSYRRVAAMCTGLVLASVLLGFLPVYLPWGFDIGLLGAVFMFHGFLLRRSAVFENKKWTLLVTIVSSVGFAVCHFYNGQANMAIHLYGRNILVFLLSGAFSSVALIGVCRMLDQVKLLQTALSYVGRNTLLILAFHTMVFGVLDKIFEIMGFTYGWAWIPRLVLTLGICLMIQLVLEKIFRIPRKFL